MIVFVVILLSFSYANAEKLKVFPNKRVYNFTSCSLRFCGFIENSATFQIHNGHFLFFTIKKLPKQLEINGRKFWILEANTDEDWILTSDQKK